MANQLIPEARGKAAAFDRVLAQGGGQTGDIGTRTKGRSAGLPLGYKRTRGGQVTYKGRVVKGDIGKPGQRFTEGKLAGQTYDQAKEGFEKQWAGTPDAVKEKYAARTSSDLAPSERVGLPLKPQKATPSAKASNFADLTKAPVAPAGGIKSVGDGSSEATGWKPLVTTTPVFNTQSLKGKTRAEQAAALTEDAKETPTQRAAEPAEEKGEYSRPSLPLGNTPKSPQKWTSGDPASEGWKGGGIPLADAVAGGPVAKPPTKPKPYTGPVDELLAQGLGPKFSGPTSELEMQGLAPKKPTMTVDRPSINPTSPADMRRNDEAQVKAIKPATAPVAPAPKPDPTGGIAPNFGAMGKKVGSVIGNALIGAARTTVPGGTAKPSNPPLTIDDESATRQNGEIAKRNLDLGYSPLGGGAPAPTATAPVGTADAAPVMQAKADATATPTPSAPPVQGTPSAIAAPGPKVNRLTGLPLGYRPGDTVNPSQKMLADASVKRQMDATAAAAPAIPKATLAPAVNRYADAQRDYQTDLDPAKARKVDAIYGDSSDLDKARINAQSLKRSSMVPSPAAPTRLPVSSRVVGSRPATAMDRKRLPLG